MVDQIGVDTNYERSDKEPVAWNHGSMHEKIAISITSSKNKNFNDENIDEEDPDWVCFGDGNHRASEITHAGLAVILLYQPSHH